MRKTLSTLFFYVVLLFLLTNQTSFKAYGQSSLVNSKRDINIKV